MKDEIRMKSIFLPLAIILVFSGVILSDISPKFFYKQLLFIGLGFLMIFLFRNFDWHNLFRYRSIIIILYALSITFLVLVLFLSPAIRNVQSWLILGSLSFQPAELAKVSLILLYAEYFSRRHLAVARWKIIFTSFLFFIVPAVLVAIQPALGSALVFFGIWFGFLLSSGLPRDKVIISLIVFAAAAFFMWNWGLKDYQRSRIVHFFYPEKNLLGVNYSVTQSKIAIGSAGLWGKGYGQGSQTKLGFLTEPANDFILAALIEEWGLTGGFIVIISFLGLIFQILKKGLVAHRNFEKFFCLGTAITFSIQFFLNTGSTLGLLPVVGLPFPFLSYGGSNILTSFFLLAIIVAA